MKARKAKKERKKRNQGLPVFLSLNCALATRVSTLNRKAESLSLSLSLSFSLFLSLSLSLSLPYQRIS